MYQNHRHGGAQSLPTGTTCRSTVSRDRDCTLFEAREERLLGLLKRQRIILRLADALMVVMDSRLVIRVENMVTGTRSTSSLEVLGVDLNGTMSNYLRLVLLILLSLLLVA